MYPLANQNPSGAVPPRVRSLFLILIFTFLSSGIALALFQQIQAYNSQQVYLATQAALPQHQNGWQRYKNQKYGFSLEYPRDMEVWSDQAPDINGGGAGLWVMALRGKTDLRNFSVAVFEKNSAKPRVKTSPEIVKVDGVQGSRVIYGLDKNKYASIIVSGPRYDYQIEYDRDNPDTAQMAAAQESYAKILSTVVFISDAERVRP